MGKLLVALMVLSLAISCIQEIEDINVPHLRVIENETEYDLSVTVFNVDRTDQDFEFQILSNQVVGFEGNLYAERSNLDYTGLGWVRADSMTVIANDLLMLRYAFPEFCTIRNPLVLVATDGCSGYEILESGDTTIWTFTFRDEDFLDAEVIGD